MRLAVMDAAGGTPRLLPRLPHGKAINPQFTPTGDALYFVADPDGISDIYRVALSGGAPTRLTTSATGVSGITGLSPAINVARGTGEIVFSVFNHGGFGIRALPGTTPDVRVADAGSATTGVAAGTLEGEPAAGMLPPTTGAGNGRSGGNYVEQTLGQPTLGLPSALPTATRPYRTRARPARARPSAAGTAWASRAASRSASVMTLATTCSTPCCR
jgi:hypothetical protein